MIIIKIIYWILLISWWLAILKYRRYVKSWTWNFYWAEHYLWRWWTYIVIIFIWLAMIFIWILYPFWWLDHIFLQNNLNTN
jgi:hypothetical protein